MQQKEFRQLYDEYAQMLFNFILWITHDRSTVDDILQNVFIKLWNSDSMPVDPVEQKRWIFTVTRNATFDLLRKSSRFSKMRLQYSLEPVDELFQPDSNLMWEELGLLSESDRSILFLHLRNGYTYKEIGEMTDLSETLVRVRAFRAIKKLRTILAKKEL